ncbi:MAG: acylneuraminate cytidylyltransferase family protein [Sulfitobacter sp.]|nr:acylneuraminate cytidylyltransferase family protein [Sulfitobacter sp.]
MKILGLMPARSGSKGMPGKNIRPLCGRSLIARAAETACSAGILDRIVLSTDDRRLAEEGLNAGAEVPFLRPAELAVDTTPMIDVAIHAIDALAEEGYRCDAVFLLQPTSPLRTTVHIRQAVALLGAYDAVCSVVALPRDLCPHYVMRIDDDGHLQHFLPDGHRYTRRQDVPLAYRRDGTVFLTRTEVLRDQRNFYGTRCVPYRIPVDQSLNIDTPQEWALAERILAGRTGEDSDL